MSKKLLVYLGFMFVLFLIQTASLKVWMESSHAVPQLLLVFTVLFALSASLPEALWFGFLGGLLLEFFSGFFFGGQIVAVAVTAIAVYFVTRRLTAQEASWPLGALLVVLATALYPFWIFIYDRLTGFLATAPPGGLGLLYSAEIFVTIAANLAAFYSLRLVFKFLPK